MKIFRHIGRRGAFYAFFGFLALLFGLGSIGNPPSAQGLKNAEIITSVAPLGFWYFSWVVVGILCVLAIWIKRLERIASGAYAGLASFSAVGYFMAQFVIEESFRPWISGMLFLSLAGCVILLAGWPEGAPKKGSK